MFSRCTCTRLLILAIIPILAGSGCRDEERPSATGGDRSGVLRIAVIPKATNHEYWKAIHAGAIMAQRELGNVRILWEGPAREDDRDQQIAVVENMVNVGVDGIVLAPLDDKALLRPVREAMKSGIPVVIMDSGLDGEPGRDYVSYVATENRLGGVRAARALAEMLNGQGNVLVMPYLQGSASTMAREAGFIDEINRNHQGIRIVSHDQYAGATTNEALNRAETLLQRFRDLDGIFCSCEPTTFGMLRALRGAGRAGDVKLMGFDRSDKLMEAMRTGELHGVVLQDPIRMGHDAVTTLVRHLHGEVVEPRIDTGSIVATPANMDEPRVAELLSPPVESYLHE